MKKLKKLFLFLACIFVLPLLQHAGKATPAALLPQLVSAADIAAQPQPPVYDARYLSYSFTSVKHYLRYKPERPRHRSRALNERPSEQCMGASCFSIKTCFVYIHPHFKGYTESYSKAALTLTDWRGPPAA